MNSKKLFSAVFFLFSSIVLGIGIYEILPIISTVSHNFGVNSASSLKVSTFFSLSYALGFLVVAKLNGKIAARKMLLISLSIVALFTLAIGFAKNYVSLLTLRFFQGAFSSFFTPIILSTVTKIFSQEWVPVVNSMVTSGFMLASVFGQLLAMYCVNTWGWKVLFIIQFLLIVIVIIGLYVILPLKPEASGPRIKSVQVK
ncbi:MFS transporter [Lactiplantibacillus plantarum]|uniref:MFS transporter n=1 Tax=Lactiplantibacillus plantarum TaxID=1590 RepID=UPI0009321B20|nr:MFS transporter [Lactiplantibacillus plantarum]